MAYRLSAHRISNELSGKVQITLESAVDTIDLMFRKTHELSVRFFMDSSVIRYLKRYDQLTSEDRAHASEVFEELSDARSLFNEFLDTVFVFTDGRVVYTAEGMDTFDDFFSKFHRYDKYPSEFWLDQLSASSFFHVLQPTGVWNATRRESTRVIPVMTMYSIGGIKAAIVAEISVKFIARIVTDKLMYDSTEFIIFDRSGNLVFSTPTAEFFPHNLAEIRNTKIEGLQYAVNTVRSDTYGWHYHVLTPMKEFVRYSIDSLRLALALCVVFSIVGLMFAFIYSYSIYRPIRGIRSIIAKDQTASGATGAVARGDDCRLIRSGVSQLIKQRTDLQKRLRLVSTHYLDDELLHRSKALLGRSEAGTDRHAPIESILSEVFGFAYGYFLCCVVYVRDYMPGDEDPSGGVATGRSLTDLVRAAYSGVATTLVLEARKDLYLCIMNLATETARAQVVRASRRLLTAAAFARPLPLVIAVGKLCVGIARISTSYVGCITAIGRMRYEGRLGIVDCEDQKIRESFMFSMEDQRAVANFLKVGDIDGLKKNLWRLLDRNVRGDASYESILKLFDAIEAAAIGALPRTEMEDVFGDALEFEYDKLLSGLLSFYRGIVPLRGASEDGRWADVVESAIRHVAENYADSALCTAGLADRLGVSQKYLSRLFRKKTGYGVAEYVNRVRVSKARELLESTFLPVHEISSRVGIVSRATFLRTFRKAEGVAPSEYRRINGYAPDNVRG